ncbi:MAG: hypothetical protein AAGI53_02580 [Planctomycetota bacterium]
MATQRVVRRLVVLSFAGGLVMLAGCSSNSEQEKLSSVRWQPTPDLLTTTKSEGELNNELFFNFDRGNRDMWDDFLRVFHADESSGLTPYPRMR